jgi:hypothetical protein
MAKTQRERCYFCGKPATSSEHVPPKCVFPEQKDLPEEDYRKNLITVPSCDEHNAAKSRDDEFLMACLAPVVGNNGTGFLHTNTKLARSHVRNPCLMSDIMRDPKPLDLVTTDGTTFPVLVGRPDMERLCRTLQAVARGLFFHTHRKRFKGKVTVIPSFVKFPPGKTMSIVQLIAQRMIDQDRTAWQTYGDNPRIFTYQFGPVDQFGMTPMVMNFYSRAEVLAAFQPKGVHLPHKNVFDATPDNPIDIEITLGDGDNARKVTWRCTGD